MRDIVENVQRQMRARSRAGSLASSHPSRPSLSRACDQDDRRSPQHSQGGRKQRSKLPRVSTKRHHRHGETSSDDDASQGAALVRVARGTPPEYVGRAAQLAGSLVANCSRPNRSGGTPAGSKLRGVRRAVHMAASSAGRAAGTPTSAAQGIHSPLPRDPRRMMGAHASDDRAVVDGHDARRDLPSSTSHGHSKAMDDGLVDANDVETVERRPRGRVRRAERPIRGRSAPMSSVHSRPTSETCTMGGMYGSHGCFNMTHTPLEPTHTHPIPALACRECWCCRCVEPHAACAGARPPGCVCLRH